MEGSWKGLLQWRRRDIEKYGILEEKDDGRPKEGGEIHKRTRVNGER